MNRLCTIMQLHFFSELLETYPVLCMLYYDSERELFNLTKLTPSSGALLCPSLGTPLPISAVMHGSVEHCLNDLSLQFSYPSCMEADCNRAMNRQCISGQTCLPCWHLVSSRIHNGCSLNLNNPWTLGREALNLAGEEILQNHHLASLAYQTWSIVPATVIDYFLIWFHRPLVSDWFGECWTADWR